MLPQRRRDINDLAASVRQAVRSETFPVDVERAIALLGGTVKSIASASHDDPEPEAMITKSRDSFTIHILESLHPKRRRFTLAHELGHLFLHMGYLINPQKWNTIDEYRDSPKYRYGYSEEEYEAHEFAGGFLMPNAVFRERVNMSASNGRVAMSTIAEYFGVSLDAARVRGQWLGILSWDR
jgi:Zn-dependent peptidase ImmA (M78 family)